MDKHYSAGIDFLRAFAVIAVILYHLPQYSFQGGNQRRNDFLCYFGLLDGKRMLPMRIKKQFSWIGFYKKRIKRIYPFLLFSLLIFILIAGSIQIRMLGNIKVNFQVYSLDITTGGRSTKKSLILIASQIRPYLNITGLWRWNYNFI